MQRNHILKALARLGEQIDWDRPIEILLVGGAAGMITGQLAPDRTTEDCDVIDDAPAEAMQAVEHAARDVAGKIGLPEGSLNSQARQLNVLPRRLAQSVSAGWTLRQTARLCHWSAGPAGNQVLCQSS